MAVLCCLIIIVGLLIPFIVGIENTKNTSRWNTKTDCTSATASRSRRISSIIQRRSSDDANKRSSDDTMRVKRSTTAAKRAANKNSCTAIYNPYNMYLCFLAVPDLILNAYLLGMYISFANQKYNPMYSAGSIVWNEIAPPAAFASFEGAFCCCMFNSKFVFECYYFIRNVYFIKIKSLYPTICIAEITKGCFPSDIGIRICNYHILCTLFHLSGSIGGYNSIHFYKHSLEFDSNIHITNRDLWRCLFPCLVPFLHQSNQ
jgi:hypothetical protein